jgi:hypothetical protein
MEQGTIRSTGDRSAKKMGRSESRRDERDRGASDLYSLEECRGGRAFRPRFGSLSLLPPQGVFELKSNSASALGVEEVPVFGP